MPSKLPKEERPAQQKSLAQELAARGIVVDDWDALWKTARQLGQPLRWQRALVDVLQLRYTPEGVAQRTYAEIGAVLGVGTTRVSTLMKAVRRRLAHPACVARYGHYVSDPPYQPQLEEL